MKAPKRKRFRKALRGQDGQALIFMILAMFVLIGFAGLAIDVGRVYVAQRQLQQAVDAAALVAGADLPDSAKAYCDAVSLSATSVATPCPQDGATTPGNQVGQNQHSGIAPGAPTVTFKCVQFLVKNNVPCQTDSGTRSAGGGSWNCQPGNAAAPIPSGTTTCNAVSVTESATVNSTFLAKFLPGGFTTIAASATAAMRGGVPHPLDIEVIVDRTGSMATTKCGTAVKDEALDTTDAISSSNSYDIDCAKDGVRRLLKQLIPCGLNIVGNCGAATPEDEVGLMAFPSMITPTSTAHDTAHVRTNLMLDATSTPTTIDSCPGKYSHANPPSWFTASWYAGTGSGPQFPQDYLNWPDDLGYNSTVGVQSVTIDATNGTFTLAYNNGTPSAAIRYNAPASAVQAALTAVLPTGGTVTVTGGLPTGPYSITYGGTLSYSSLPITANGANLTKSFGLAQGFATVAWTTVGGSPNYQVSQLSNDFKLANTGLLNGNSATVNAVSWDSCGTMPASAGNSGYPNNIHYGLSAQDGEPGGGRPTADTYYAGAIAAAQAALMADASRHAQPVIILLSDGDANIKPSGDTNDPCQEAIDNATAASSSSIHTWVYSIAYNSPTSPTGGCIKSPFETMKEIAQTNGAQDPTRLFCVSRTNSCGTAQSASSLAAAFTSIGTNLTASRLLPDGTP